VQISEDEQTYTDFDWFCVDLCGNVGHFTSAGYKAIPSSVARSAEDLRFLTDFFAGLNAAPDAHALDEHLVLECRTGRYLRDFIAMANRGLYSFDIESHLKPGICYFRVALPKSPLRFADLPEGIRAILGRTVLADRSLEECSVVPYSDTLNI
jgi:hypothetical protein